MKLTSDHKKIYDFLVVGAGPAGAAYARAAHDRGYRVLVVEKKGHVAGHIYTKELEGIQVHVYGPHIFHTANESVWSFVNRYGQFNRFTNSPLANYNGSLYNLPFNMNTFHQMWAVKTPAEVGTDIYNSLIREYTEKQWGRACRDLPAFIIRRLPLRYTYDNNYFNDPHQGIPVDGYTAMIEKMLDGRDVRLNCDYLTAKDELSALADQVIYTGAIDA